MLQFPSPQPGVSRLALLSEGEETQALFGNTTISVNYHPRLKSRACSHYFRKYISTIKLAAAFPFLQTTTMSSVAPQRIPVNRPEASDTNAITGQTPIRIKA